MAVISLTSMMKLHSALWNKGMSLLQATVVKIRVGVFLLLAFLFGFATFSLLLLGFFTNRNDSAVLLSPG